MSIFKKFIIPGILASTFLLMIPFHCLAQNIAIDTNTPVTTLVEDNSSDRIQLKVNATLIEPDSILLLRNDSRIMIDIKNLDSILNCKTEWLEPEQIAISNNYSKIIMSLNQQDFIINGSSSKMDIFPYLLQDGVVLVPLRAVAEALTYRVAYDDASNTIIINSANYPLPTDSKPPVTSLPVIDFQALPTWGSFSQNPELKSLWKDESIIAGYYTRLTDSPPGRTTNIELSSNKINGKILQPGEVFSFNQTVGPRTTAAGYQIAKVFVGKNIISGIGGGICQTSSTIYNAALEAGMQIINRYAHSLKVAYVPADRDATVSWGGADFKFCNNKEFPVKILCKVENSLVFVAICKVDSPAGDEAIIK